MQSSKQLIFINFVDIYKLHRFWLKLILYLLICELQLSHKVQQHPRSDVLHHSSIKNSCLPVQKCPPNPGLHRSHLPVDTSHTVSFWLLPHLHTLQKSPKNPGLHRPHLPVDTSQTFPSKLFWHSHSVNVYIFLLKYLAYNEGKSSQV